MSGLNARQVAQLLKPIAPQRVLADGKGHSHVSQQDVRAHLIRVFGFGNFDIEVLSTEMVFEHPRTEKKPDGPEFTGRWDVCYRAIVRLTIRNAAGDVVCRYEDGATHTAQNQAQGDAHDLAMKSAISLALKRCAVNLGDQFGLSLYNKGQTAALVIDSLVKPTLPDNRDVIPGRGPVGPDPNAIIEHLDVQVDVPAQLTLGDEGSDAA